MSDEPTTAQHTRKLRIPLDGPIEAEITVPEWMSEDDFETILSTLDAWRWKLVHPHHASTAAMNREVANAGLAKRQD